MAVWIVRAGKQGESETLALEQNLAIIGWSELPDLSSVTSRGDLEQVLLAAYPQAKPKTTTMWVAQVWAFLRRIEKGELVVLPLKTRSAIAVGRMAGDYVYRADLPEGSRHARPVQWLRTDIPRVAFGEDLLYSFGAYLTVGQVRRENAESRIVEVVDGKPDPGASQQEEIGPELVAITDLEEHALDQIRTHIEQTYRGHSLARLIREALGAQGYQTELSAPGPDCGVDIIAGRGAMGFDPPRLCVQVKSGGSPVDVTVLRELQGVMKNFGADQGLVIS